MNAAIDAYLSTASNRLNVTTKQLAVIATIFLPLTFVTGFFGQNFGWMVDHVRQLAGVRRARPRARGRDRWSPCSCSSACGAGFEAALGTLAAGVHPGRRPAGGLRLLPRLRARGRAGARRAPRRARLRAPEPLPVRLRAPDGGAVPARGRLRRRSGRRGAGDPPAHGAGPDVLGRSWARRASTSAGTSAGSQAPASSTTCTSTSSRAGPGDTNFMPVLADVKVMPEALEATRRKLAEAWP